MIKKVYTTKEVGNFCGVDLTTVINWVKKGNIKAYKTAGGHRRIKHADLIEFMKEYSIPVPEEFISLELTKILIVDDDQGILALIDTALKKLDWKYETATAEDGFDVGNRLARYKPNIIVMDMKLHGIDIYTIVKKIKENGSGNEKILVIISYHDPDTKEKILKAGADLYLEKPFSVEDFIIAIRKLKT